MLDKQCEQKLQRATKAAATFKKDANRVPKLEEALLSGNMLLPNQKAVATDAVVLAEGEKAVATDAIVLAEGEKAVAKDAVVLAEGEKAVATDAIVLDDVEHNKMKLEVFVGRAVGHKVTTESFEEVFPKAYVEPIVKLGCTSDHKVQEWAQSIDFGKSVNMEHLCNKAQGEAIDYTVEL